MSSHFHSPYPYVNTCGQEVASDWNDLTNSVLAIHIINDNNGEAVTPGYVWTNAQPNGLNYQGTSIEHACEQWTNETAGLSTRAGHISFTGAWWTLMSTKTCNSLAALYCVEQ